MKNVVGITGYNGFIGKHLLKALADDRKIQRLVLIGRRSIEKTPNKVAWVPFDLTKEYRGEPIKIDTLIHLAGEIKKNPHDEKSKEYFESNVFGTYNLLKNFQVNHLIYASTVDVYGKAVRKITEKTHANPSDAYSFSKFLGELLSKYILSPTRVTVLRIGNVYGDSDNSSKLIPSVFRNFRNGLKVTVYGDGSYTRDYINIGDVVNIIKIFVEKRQPGVFNVVSGNSTQIINVVTEIAKFFDYDRDKLEFKSLPIRLHSIEFNNSKLLSVIGNYNFKDFKEGLREIYEANKNIL